MRNMQLVTEAMAKEKAGSGDPWEVMSIIPRIEGGLLFQDKNGELWRMFKFIGDTMCYDLTAFIDPNQMSFSLPWFHITQTYYDRWQAVVTAGGGDVHQLQDLHRDERVQRLHEETQDQRGLALSLTDLVAQRVWPIRVTHNDPKLSNFLFGKGFYQHQVVAMIDLDTVQSGFVIFDVGDAIRSIANVSGEEGTKPETVSISLSLFQSFVRGYLEQALSFLTNGEVTWLADAPK